MEPFVHPSAGQTLQALAESAPFQLLGSVTEGRGDKLEKISAPDCQAWDAQPGFCPDFNILCAVME